MYYRIAVGFFLIVMSLNAWSIDPIYTPWYNNNAIEGYDTVAYHLQNKAVKGSKKYSYEWQGANWLFSSQENRDLFADQPDKYAPQYGGYCAYAVSQNTTAGIDPTQFSIINGKLYLNFNKKIQETWSKDAEAYIEKADTFWPQLNR